MVNTSATKLSKVDGQRDVFTLRVRNASQSITGAREAARYEATVYCVTKLWQFRYQMGRGAGHPAREFAPCGRRFDVSGGLPFLIVCATYRLANG